MPRKKHRHDCKRSGHYCWACDCYRPNEKFSGRGHGRHLCRDCARLGEAELTYLQALRNLERCVTWEGIIPRKRRKTFQHFLAHEDPRIRAAAEELARMDQRERALMRGLRETYDDCSEPGDYALEMWGDLSDDDQQHADSVDPVDMSDIP